MQKATFLSIAFLFLFNSSYAQELHVAAGQGDLEKVKKILKKDSSQLNFGYGYGAPLHYAARRGHKNVVNFLIKKGADINLKLGDTSPLFHAAFKDHKDVVETLMLNGAYIGFFEAIECGYRGIVIQMTSRGEDFNQFNNSGIHPLCRAARYGNKEIVYYFIENGIDVNLAERSGSTLLHNAAFGGQYELVKYLVDLQADINAKTTRGETPLDYALYNGHQKIVKFLKKNGAETTYSIEPKLTRVSENIYAVSFPNRADSNVGLYITPHGAILIDTGGGFQIGEILNEIVEKNHKPKINYVINTHIDWDHIGGNTFYKGKSTIINVFNIDEMLNKGIIHIVNDRLKSNYEEIFGKYYKMTLDGEEIILIPAPGTHSASDMFIYFKNEDVIFTGDILSASLFRKEIESDDEYEKRIKKQVEMSVERGIINSYDFEVLENIIRICPPTTNCVGGHWKSFTFTMKDVEEYLSIAIEKFNQLH